MSIQPQIQCPRCQCPLDVLSLGEADCPECGARIVVKADHRVRLVHPLHQSQFVSLFLFLAVAAIIVGMIVGVRDERTMTVFTLIMYCGLAAVVIRSWRTGTVGAGPRVYLSKRNNPPAFYAFISIMLVITVVGIVGMIRELLMK